MSKLKYYYQHRDEIIYIGCLIGFLIWLLASWITHIIFCIENKEWLFLIAGAIMVPIAWVHGTGIWFGVW